MANYKSILIQYSCGHIESTIESLRPKNEHKVVRQDCDSETFLKYYDFASLFCGAGSIKSSDTIECSDKLIPAAKLVFEHKLKLVIKNGYLFATNNAGELQGRIINHNNEKGGYVIDNPSEEDSSHFDRLFGGHGDIFEVRPNPTSPFYHSSWEQIFQNPEMLPPGTKAVFLEMEQQTVWDWSEVR